MNKTRYLKGECQLCAGHIEFPAETIGSSIPCPHCGETTELLLAPPPQEPPPPKRGLVWLAVATVMLVLGLAGALAALKQAQKWGARHKNAQAGLTPASAGDAAPESVADGLAAQNGFRVSPVTLEKTPGSSLVYAEGTVKNPTQRQRFGVQVELDLFAADGAKVGSAKDYQAVIEPGAEWNFKALVLEPRAASAKIVKVREQ